MAAHLKAPAGTLINNLALDTAKTTALIKTEQFGRLLLDVDLTRGGTLTAVVITVEESSDDGATWSDVQGESAGTLTPLTLTRTTSVSERFSYALDVKPYMAVRVTLTGTGANSSDLVTLRGVLSRGP